MRIRLALPFQMTIAPPFLFTHRHNHESHNKIVYFLRCGDNREDVEIANDMGSLEYILQQRKTCENFYLLKDLTLQHDRNYKHNINCKYKRFNQFGMAS